jgi:hypothetical protein
MMKQIIAIIILAMGIGGLFLAPGNQQSLANNLPPSGGIAGSGTQTNTIPSDTGNTGMFSGNSNGQGANTNTEPTNTGDYGYQHHHPSEFIYSHFGRYHHHPYIPRSAWGPSIPRSAWGPSIPFDAFGPHHHHHLGYPAGNSNGEGSAAAENSGGTYQSNSH